MTRTTAPNFVAVAFYMQVPDPIAIAARQFGVFHNAIAHEIGNLAGTDYKAAFKNAVAKYGKKYSYVLVGQAADGSVVEIAHHNADKGLALHESPIAVIK